VFTRHDVANPGELADTALDALTAWRYVDSGERCRCSCHPRLPDSHLHDYGFDCVCTRTPEERRRAFQQWLDDIKAFWQSPDGQHIKAAQQAGEAELQAWLADHQGVVVHSHGGLCSEQWTGEVDGQSFYFRERHAEWRIELDLRPTGRFIRTVAGTDNDGATCYEERELDQGNVIAYGATDIEGYGTTPLERAQFITDTIRIHLARQAGPVVVEVNQRSQGKKRKYAGPNVSLSRPSGPVFAAVATSTSSMLRQGLRGLISSVL
jgi:hypothetical protein